MLISSEFANEIIMFLTFYLDILMFYQLFLYVCFAIVYFFNSINLHFTRDHAISDGQKGNINIFLFE